MNSNPFESTLLPPEAPTASGPRPKGITILSVLAAIGGALLLVLPIVLAAQWSEFSQAFSNLGMPPWLAIVGILFVALLSLTSGIGMWLGRQWGWWLGCFYYVYSVFRNASALLMIIGMGDALDVASRGTAYYVSKHSIRIVFSLLLIAYFCRNRVLEYFDLASINKIKTLTIQAGICVAIVIVFSVIAALLT